MSEERQVDESAAAVPTGVAEDVRPEAAPPVESGALPLVLTVEELAALLRVNRKTAYEAVAAGTIPGARWLGKTIRISRDAVLDWLRTGQGRVRSRRSR